jgi:hypothetical protein
MRPGTPEPSESSFTLPREVSVTCSNEHDTFACHLTDVHGRFAIRAYAFSVAQEDPALAKHLLAAVGREG